MRFRKSRGTLHRFSIDSKALTWDALILSAQGELSRITKRAVHLNEAIELFQKRKEAGDPCLNQPELPSDGATHI